MLFHKAFCSAKVQVYNNNLFFLELKDYCELNGDCREFAYTCIRNFCECAEGYKADERNKTCVGGETEL
jgi:hypothetical protein